MILLEKLLRYITLTFLEHPGYTLADIPRLLRDDTYRANIVSQLKNDAVKAYWQQEYDAMTPSERRKETQALDNRLTAFITEPWVKNIVCQRNTTIDFRHAIQEQEVLLIRLPRKLKDNFATLLGTILLAQIHAATFEFGAMDWDKRPGFSLYVDEFQHFATSDFADLFKEGRKFGIRIIVAHQDRSDLIPAIRSATLTASIIISFQPTPADAAEIAPVHFDATINLRPEYIHPDVIQRLRLHENSEVQDFFRSYVLPLQKGESDQKEDNQKILELLQDILYQAVKTETINETLFEEYAKSMFFILDLIPDRPEKLQQKIQDQLRIYQDSIESLTALLTNDQTFCKYLVAYYSHYRTYARDHYDECYNQPQSLVPEEILLTDTEFWIPLIRNFSRIGHLPIEFIVDALEKEAAEYHALDHSDTVEKIITHEREKIIRQGKQLFQQIWNGIATLHRLKSQYVTGKAMQVFHAQAYQHIVSTPVQQLPSPIYLQPVGCTKGTLDRCTRIKELVIEPLAFQADKAQDVAQWLLSAHLDTRTRGKEELRAPEAITKLWLEITRAYTELSRLTGILADETALLKVYYAQKENHAWKKLNDEHIDTNVWEEIRKEAKRNAFLSHHMNTVEKLIQLRKSEVRKKIASLAQEREAFQATIPSQQNRFDWGIAAVEEKRTAFRDEVRDIIEILIQDPGSLGQKRTPKESDTKDILLDLPNRQALVRIGGDINQKPRKCTMKTLNAQQAVRREEVERRLQQIREQTRSKYNRPRIEVEQEFRSSPIGNLLGDASEAEEKHDEDASPDTWYEE